MKTLYFLNRGDILNEDFTVPIKPRQSDWHTEDNPSRLVRSFEFESYRCATYFVIKLMRYADKINHHPDISVSANNSVLVETYTHEINDITAQDTRLARVADQIYRDIADMSEKDETEEVDVNNDERLTERYRFDWTTDW